MTIDESGRPRTGRSSRPGLYIIAHPFRYLISGASRDRGGRSVARHGRARERYRPGLNSHSHRSLDDLMLRACLAEGVRSLSAQMPPLD